MRQPLGTLAFVTAVALLAAAGGCGPDQGGTPASLDELARRSLATIDGELAVPGLQEPVEVIRDEWGVPHIYAQNDDDLFFAQGYVMAQDRLVADGDVAPAGAKGGWPRSSGRMRSTTTAARG